MKWQDLFTEVKHLSLTFLVSPATRR